MLGLHQAGLTGIANNEFSADALVPQYAIAIGMHLLLGALGVGTAALSLKRVQAERTTLVLRIAASALVLIAVFVTRLMFYDLHMTVGF